MGELSKQAGVIETKAEKPVEHDANNNSSTLLDRDGAKKFFHTLAEGYVRELYRRWRNCKVRVTSWQSHDERPWDGEDTKKLDELRDLSWGDFKTIEHVLDLLSQTSEAMNIGAEAAVRDLQQAWTGKDGDAAGQRLSEFAKASSSSSEALRSFYDHLRLMGGNTFAVIRDLSEWASSGEPAAFVKKYGHYRPHSGEGTDEDGMRKMVDWIDGDPDVTFGMTNEEIAEEIDTWNIRESTCLGYINKLDEVARDYCRMITAVRSRIDHAQSTISELFNTYVSSVNGLEINTFSKLQKPKLSGKGGGEDRRGGSQRTGTGPTSTGNGPGSVTPTTSSSSTPGTSTPSTSTPSTSTLDTSTPSTTTPSDAGSERQKDGTNPVTGKPLEYDPRTGKPYPIDPETGEPVKEYDDQDTTTVRQGDKEISVTEPSATGEMKVTVDDGKGGTKTYNLDFDPTKNPGDAKGDKDAQGQSVSGTASGAFGPQGSAARDVPAGKAGAEDTVHTPGEDGKIRIKDGDVEIVAQQPEGADGVTVVRVDDGSGEPITEILGDEEAVEEYKRQLAEERQTLISEREALEARNNASSSEWEALAKKEQDFRERGGMVPSDDTETGKASSPAASAEERSTPRSVFDAAEQERHGIRASSPAESAAERSEPRSVFDAAESERRAERSSVGGSALSELKADGGGPGVGHGVSGGGSGASVPGGGGASTMGGGHGGESVGGSAQNLNAGGYSGAVPGGGAPAGGTGDAPATGPGVGSAPGGGDTTTPRGGAMMGGAPMMAGAAGAGGSDETRSSNSSYQVPASTLFEPDIPEGPFGVARISGSLDDEGES